MTNTSGLQSDEIAKIAIGAIVGVAVLGALLSLVVTKVVGRVIILVIVVVLGGAVWSQRTSIQNKVKNCDLNMTFFGKKVTMPKDVLEACKAQHKLPSTAAR
jgi:hypothetical protein